MSHSSGVGQDVFSSVICNISDLISHYDTLKGGEAHITGPPTCVPA